MFGILERQEKVKGVKDVCCETLLREMIKKVKRGSLIYTDKFKSYDGLVMYERVDKRIRFAKDFGVMPKRDFLSFTE